MEETEIKTEIDMLDILDPKLIYRIYCSKCNRENKQQMGWMGYGYYMVSDRKSKGRYEIESDFLADPPTQCPQSHPIDTNRTKTIISIKTPKTI